MKSLGDGDVTETLKYSYEPSSQLCWALLPLVDMRIHVSIFSLIAACSSLALGADKPSSAKVIVKNERDGFDQRDNALRVVVETHLSTSTPKWDSVRILQLSYFPDGTWQAAVVGYRKTSFPRSFRVVGVNQVVTEVRLSGL